AWIIEIAKNDGPGRADRLACRDDVPVDQALIAFFGFDPRVGDALHAVRALFHHTAHAHRHLRIALRLEAFRVLVGVLEKIKAAHLVGTVVRAKPRADAAVIHLQIQSLRIVDRRFDRANGLAGHPLEVGARLLGRALVVAIDADPVHFAPAPHFGLADDRYVVLRLAGDRAG